MRKGQLRRKLRRQARKEQQAWRIDFDQYRAVLNVTGSPAALSELQRRLDEEKVGQLWGAPSFNSFFANLWDWVAANWPEILELVLQVAPMFMEGYDEEDS